MTGDTSSGSERRAGGERVRERGDDPRASADAESRPAFSLVFLTWNPGDAIVAAIDSVCRQDFEDYEVVVVDNGSDDGTPERVRGAYPDEPVRVFENDRNRGFSRGINRGIRESRGRYVCTYNHDTQFPVDYLSTLADRVTPEAVWTTARRNYRVDPRGTYVRLLSRYRFTVPYVVDSLSGTAAVNYVPGDGTVVPRRIYREELDGEVFDPSMPTRGEDVDLSLRLADSGVPMRAVLDTHSIHPDKGDIYAPSVANFAALVRTIGARMAAHSNNSVPRATVALAAASLVTQPLNVYFAAYPRSAEAFVEATTVRRREDRPTPADPTFTEAR
ncbi:glycosyltransferase family 2 protein [Halosimplex rubrum]|uniref:Glycosyltransferase family 2 protein n=1 Tax=Halosimplex rubrum TaxID=869889 RepID=A0A7D5T4U5_9EURY|nr:glycosyltransferase family 2 protein [Halosimplex rubrum]QLH77289.1 glycosyltransferase family 2 protein [Halosimplex rubrum]